MRPLKPLRLLGLLSLIGLICLTGLTGCAPDSEVTAIENPTHAPEEEQVTVAGFVAKYLEKEAGASGSNGSNESNGNDGEARAFTRAWTAPSDFKAYEGMDKIIGINFTQDSPAKKLDGFFFNSSGQWRMNIKDEEGKQVEELPIGTYYLYGYTPHTAGLLCTIEPDATSGKYEDGAVMTISNLSTVTPSDICVVVGAKNGTGPETVDGLTKGDFTYEAAGEHNYVFLLFDHLYAALNLQIKVDDKYDALRTIMLKKITLRAYSGDATTANTKKTNVTVTLKKTSSESGPIKDIVFTPQGEADSEGTAFFTANTADGQMLTTTLQKFQSHFMPQGVTKIVLTSNYDVYDKQGNLIRRDQKADNVIDFKAFDRVETASRGTQYTIKMTIEPTYLYQLSEPDLASPDLNKPNPIVEP